MGMLNFLETRLRALGVCFSKDPGGRWLEWGRGARAVDQGLDYLHRSAALGHPEGLLEVGLYYAAGGYGSGGKGAAEGYFRRAAEKGEAEGAFHLAEALRWRSQKAEALRWYRKSAEGGFRPAARSLAEAYAAGDLVEPDEAQAQKWAELAAGLPLREPRRSALLGLGPEGRQDPLVRLGRALQEAMDEVGEDLARRAWFVPVFSGLVVALLTLLTVVPVAVVVIGSAAFHFVPLMILVPSLLMLGEMHRRLRKEHGPSKDHWLLGVRADRGEAQAVFELGLASLRGSPDLPKDPAEARRRFEMAAAAGHPGACHELAGLLHWGQGGPPDPARAEALLRAAAEQGHRPALARLAQALELGDGLERNPEEARKWRDRLASLPPEVEGPAESGEEGRVEALVRRADEQGLRAASQGWFPWVFWPLLLVTGLALAAGFAAFVVLTPHGWMAALGLVPLGGWAFWGWLTGERGTSFGTSRRLAKAEGGDPEACYRHGRLCLQGTRDVPRDAAAARHWFLRAAQGGHGGAMVELAKLLRWGSGGLRRPEEALAWLRRAAGEGQDEARRMLAEWEAESAPEAGD